LNNYRESYKPNKQQRSMLSTTKLQGPCDKNYSITELRFQIGPVKVKNYVLRIGC